ncbi:MAG: histidine phosphatase family protein [Bacteroidia bacterium]|nr:histidine phosphatase family protein [Bacteroidia bacterium]
MKQLVLMRHAKASKNLEHNSDFERNLIEKGKTDAAYMGALLKKNKSIPDYMVCSPAKRTLKTAQIVAKEIGFEADRIDLENVLYEAGLDDLKHVIRNISDEFDTAMLVGHNPAITGIVGYLSPTFVQHLPTSGIAIIQFEVDTWKMIQAQSGKVIWFQNPKNIIL